MYGLFFIDEYLYLRIWNLIINLVGEMIIKGVIIFIDIIYLLFE